MAPNYLILCQDHLHSINSLKVEKNLAQTNEKMTDMMIENAKVIQKLAKSTKEESQRELEERVNQIQPDEFVQTLKQCRFSIDFIKAFLKGCSKEEATSRRLLCLKQVILYVNSEAFDKSSTDYIYIVLDEVNI
jgi:hypothetical protein